MDLQLRKAERRKAKLRIGLAAPSGGGKTLSALLLAYGITNDWEKIALIDTENGSGELYVNETYSDVKIGSYNYLRLNAPFEPEKYIEAIKICENAGVEIIIIDSITHEWSGSGGCLDIHSRIPGNSFTAWAKVTPRHTAFIDSIIQSPIHIITTVRKKQDYSMDNNGGKTQVTKLGLAEVQREGYSYELTLNFDIDIKHYAIADKDRTGLFMDKPAFKITPETGKILIEWANTGKEAEKVEYIPTEIKDAASPQMIEKLKAKATLEEINTVCGLKVKDWKMITQEQASNCLIKLLKK